MLQKPLSRTKLFFRAIFIAAYILFIFLIALYSYRRPSYNWDMMGYMGVLVKMADNDSSSIHNEVYKTAKVNIPAAQHQLLLQGEYRQKMGNNSSAFYEQLPFYAAKPLYSSLSYLFWKSGFSLPMSTILPSILAYLLIGILIVIWLSKYLSFFFNIVISLLVMSFPFLTELARSSTPDCLSAFTLLTAFYFITEKPSFTLMSFFLLLSIFVRIDNIIACCIILSFLYFAKSSSIKITLPKVFFVLLIFIFAYLSITITMKPFGWHILYYPTFFKYLDLSHEYQESFSVMRYISLIVSKIANAVFYSHFSLFLLFLSLSLYSPILKVKKINFDQKFVLLFIFIIFIRFFLFPDLSDRFYISYYLCSLLLLIKQYSNIYKHYLLLQNLKT